MKFYKAKYYKKLAFSYPFLLFMRKVNYWAIFIAIFFIYGYLMASYTDLKDWQIILSAAIFGGIYDFIVRKIFLTTKKKK